MFTIFGIAHVARSPGTTINTCSEAVFKMPLCRLCLYYQTVVIKCMVDYSEYLYSPDNSGKNSHAPLEDCPRLLEVKRSKYKLTIISLKDH